MTEKTLLVHDTFLTKWGAERMNIEIAKILSADIATAIWHENCFQIEDFSYKNTIFLTEKNFQKWMFGFLKMKWNFFRFWQKKSLKKYRTFFLSNEASTVVWWLEKTAKKIFYAHSVSRHLFDLYDEYLQKVPKYAKIPYKIMAWILKKIYIRELQKFDIILTNSPENQKRLKAWCKVDSCMLFPSVDTKKFAPIALNEKNAIFQKYKNFQNFLAENEDFYISFSRVNHIKRVDVIIRAFQKHPDKKLLIIFGTEDSGRGDFMRISWIEPTKKQNIFLQSDTHKNIFWLSLAENNDLPKIIAHATATICMSKNEDFGMVAIESMAAGIPVIAPPEGGYKHTIINGKTGFFLKENTEQSLAHFLQKITKKTFDNMKKNCVIQAEKFSLENFEKNLIHALNSEKIR